MLTGDGGTSPWAWAFKLRGVRTDLMGKLREIAAKIAANGPIGVRAIRESVRARLGRAEEDGLRKEAEFARPVYDIEDAFEGPRAFMEKRMPVHRGR